MNENKQITTEIQKRSKLNPNATSFVTAKNPTHEVPVKKSKPEKTKTRIAKMQIVIIASLHSKQI